MNEAQKLAKELLITQIKAHTQSSGGMAHASKVAEWYPQCLATAKAIIEVAGAE